MRHAAISILGVWCALWAGCNEDEGDDSGAESAGSADTSAGEASAGSADASAGSDTGAASECEMLSACVTACVAAAPDMFEACYDECSLDASADAQAQYDAVVMCGMTATSEGGPCQQDCASGEYDVPPCSDCVAGECEAELTACFG